MSFARNFDRVRFAAHHLSGALVAVVGASVVSFAGCFSISDGIPPPLDAFCYPTGLLVSPGRTALYVTNSDFELQYSGGTVQALDLPALRKKSRALRVDLNEAVFGGASEAPPEKPQATSETCKDHGLSANDNTALYPGPCSYVDAAPFIKKSVIVGAFASGATLALRPDPCTNGRGARLFVAVRGDPSVTYFDVTDDRELSCSAPPLAACLPCANQIDCFDCGDETNDGRCDKSHLVGKDPTKSQREIVLPIDPYGMDVDAHGEAVVVAHPSNQTASLVVNKWGNISNTPDGCVPGVPALEYYTSSLSPGPTGVASLPIPLLIEEKKLEYTPAFVVSYRSSPEFTLLRYEDDDADPARPFLTRGLSAGVATTASSVDSRGVAIDATERRACEKACGTMDREVCLRACAENHPLGVYMANRAPAALVIGRIETKFTEGPGPNGGVEVTGAYEVPSFHDSVPLAFGTSHIALGTVVNAKGGFSRRIFAVTFDSRFVFSYDPDARRVDAIIRTGRGPHAVTFDSGYECKVDVKKDEVCPSDQLEPYSTMYVSHFTDSYVGVVDLDMRNRATFGSIYMTLGKPVPPKGSQ